MQKAMYITEITLIVNKLNMLDLYSSAQISLACEHLDSSFLQQLLSFLISINNLSDNMKMDQVDIDIHQIVLQD